MINLFIWKFIRWYKIICDRIALSVLDKPLPPASAQELTLIAELRQRIATESSPLTLPKWLQFRTQLRRDIEERDPREFLRWDVIKHTMCVTNSPSVVRELAAMAASAKWNSRYKKAVVESPTGHPVPFLLKPDSSGNLLHHCHHIYQFEQRLGVAVDELDLIVEFGGGYGSMCRLVHQLGFRGRYVIYDLVEFSALQAFFLKSLSLPVRENAPDISEPGIYLMSDLDATRMAVEETRRKRSLFIATWSLSESPVEVRDQFLPIVDDFDYYLIAFQDRFSDVDNREYFRQFAQRKLDTVRWHSQRLRHLPLNNYLFGRKTISRAG